MGRYLFTPFRDYRAGEVEEFDADDEFAAKDEALRRRLSLGNSIDRAVLVDKQTGERIWLSSDA